VDNNSTKLAQWLATLQSNKLPNIELKLQRMLQFLSEINNPQAKLPPVIHVAGTNGKGSTIAFLHAIIIQSGLTAHRYTSPHLVRFNERIIIKNQQATDSQLLDTLKDLEPYFTSFPLTFFEATTAIALHLFAKERADLTLLEVGMGGRFDATNVIESPQLTVITPISYDHQEFLGDDIAKIAFEKAGIIKPNVTSIIGEQPDEALQVIKARADLLNAPLFCLKYEWDYEITSDKYLHYKSETLEVIAPPPALLGLHQYHNAAVAIACIDCLNKLNLHNININTQAISQGISGATWLGRLQKLDLSAHGFKQNIFLDGGHNQAGAEAIATWLQAHPCKPHLIIGLKSDKLAYDFINLLAPFCSSMCFVPVPNVAFHEPDSLKIIANKCGVVAEIAADVPTALQQAPANDILIAGSLYLIGEVLRIFTN
jgi:dihydrofolate synthase / folylpolyglutamate synthase